MAVWEYGDGTDAVFSKHGMGYRAWFAVCIVVLFTAVLILSGGCSPSGRSGTAVIIDQLNKSESASSFSTQLIPVLEDYGFDVDLYGGSEVTVDLYLYLFNRGYKLIILRSHSGLLSKDEQLTSGTWLFTNEPHHQLKYIDKRLQERIVKARTADDQPWVFAVGADFIAQSVDRMFDNSVVIAMGCYSLYHADLAEAFLERGARAYIGWDGNVSQDYTDRATAKLLDCLCRQKLTIRDSIETVMLEIGPEEPYNSQLSLYPGAVKDLTLRDLIK